MIRRQYSVDAERKYYESAPCDRQALPYAQLDAHVAGSVGLAFVRGKRVLDIGAGEGLYSAWIADAERGGATEVTGVELVEHRIRREYEDRLPNLHFVTADIFQMEPKKEFFDVVFMNLVLHHLRFRIDDVLRFVLCSLTLGGKFLAIEPNVYSPAALIAHMISDRSMNEGFLSPHRVRMRMRLHGFRDVRIGYFWRNRRWAQNPLIASSFWIVGER